MWRLTVASALNRDSLADPDQNKEHTKFQEMLKKGPTQKDRNTIKLAGTKQMC